MKLLERVLLLSALALAVFTSACDPVSVPPWPYTTATDDAGAATDDAGSDDGASSAASGQGTVDASAIEINYGGPVPLRCDGGLCNTDNYSLCNIADRPVGSGAGVSLSVLVIVAGMA